MKNDRHIPEAPLSPVRQAWLMLVVIAPMAACYRAIKLGLDSAPPLRFGALRTLVGGLALLVALVSRRKPLWPEARLAPWILPLGLLATTLTFGAMFASPAYTGAGIVSVLGNTQPLIIIVLAALFLSDRSEQSGGAAVGIGRCDPAGVVGIARANRKSWRLCRRDATDFSNTLLAQHQQRKNKRTTEKQRSPIRKQKHMKTQTNLNLAICSSLTLALVHGDSATKGPF